MTKRILGLFAAVAAAVLDSSGASAAPTAQDAMGSVRFLVGTWKCAHTVGDFSGTYAETSRTRSTGAGSSKRTTSLRRAPNRRSTPSTSSSTTSARPRWVRFGAHSNGQYYGMYSTSAGDSSWAWNYVLPSAKGTSTWTKRSSSEYTIDGPEYPENGKLVTEHHRCTKAP